MQFEESEHRATKLMHKYGLEFEDMSPKYPRFLKTNDGCDHYIHKSGRQYKYSYLYQEWFEIIEDPLLKTNYRNHITSYR